MMQALMLNSIVRVFNGTVSGGAGNAFVRPNNDGTLDYIVDATVTEQLGQWSTVQKPGAPTMGSNYNVMMETISGNPSDWVGNLRDVWLSMGIFPSWGVNGNPSGPNVGRLHFRRGGSGNSIGSGLITLQVP